MIRELTLENFRAFRALHLAGLGRVNLLVGANNSGKTSVLEGVAFLASGGDPEQLHESLSRRGEQALGDDDPSPDPAGDAVDVRHVFFGRKIGDDVVPALRPSTRAARGSSFDCPRRACPTKRYRSGAMPSRPGAGAPLAASAP